MASLTPLSKGLIGLAVVGAMASAVWHLGLKDRLGPMIDAATKPTPSSTPSTPSTAAPAVAPATAPTSVDVATSAGAPGVTGATAASRLSPAENAELGRQLLDSGNFAQARVHLELAVQGGDGSAACHLGDMTLKGQGGIAASQDQAAKLFQLAQSHNIICFASGN